MLPDGDFGFHKLGYLLYSADLPQKFSVFFEIDFGFELH
jgi:hypothetical protein